MIASLVTQSVKNLPAVWETQVRSLGQEDSLEKGMATHSRQRSLVGCSPWARKELGMTEQPTLTEDLMVSLMRGSQHLTQADWKPQPQAATFLKVCI